MTAASFDNSEPRYSSRGMAYWLFWVTVILLYIDGSTAATDVSLGKPRIIKCRSPQQETITCYWTNGEFRNLSLSGLLKLQYKKKTEANWTDCPDTITGGENSCYFSKTYTSIWVSYCTKLVSEDTEFDDYCFSVDDIVEPDPPMALNWTVLNISLTRMRIDIQLSWEPPPSADVSSGWISLEYEVHLKEANESQWTILDKVQTKYLPVYALKTGKDYFARVRCKQLSNGKFGEFSDVLHIPLSILPEPDLPDVPFLLFLIIGLFGMLLVFIFILVFKKKRLKMIILPPVPVPKIKGIDPDLLQRGKLDEVNSILACHDHYKQQLYNDDPWVEFIELDLDDTDEKNEGSDTDRLLGEEHRKNHNCLGVKDDDSGRASCCEPDIPETDFSNSDTCDGTSDLGQTQNVKENEADLLCLDEKSNSVSPTNVSVPNTEDGSPKPEAEKTCPVAVSENEPTSLPVSAPISKMRAKPSMDFYALVSDITPAGRLLLSPGQRMKNENEECNQTVIQHPANLNPDSPYICESAVTAFCAASKPRDTEASVKPNVIDDSYFTTESLNIPEMNPCFAEKASSYDMPVSDYTSVHIINSPQNLVLNTTVLPNKEFLAPCGYMTPDQVNKVMK
ncbi:growth hormone receptor isoform X1 [Xenopus laevis]|uniref:Growth hormone receptor isoform X1 n=3 Tax=Xenopus laevis TaxID=8355 RepID=A0A8J1LAD2_XENLA|nr:growth hormone receptor isoform X1 [Xenopus laevis]XP_041426482.1 growth hormone receptor isoform X1 [Xenopus laevis]